MEDEAIETPEEQLAKQHRKEKKEMQGSPSVSGYSKSFRIWHRFDLLLASLYSAK